MNNKLYFFALNRINGIGPRTVVKLLQRWPDLEELFRLPATQLEQAGLRPATAAAIATYDLNQVDADWRWQEANDHYLLTWDDCEYPALLKEIADPPTVLYARGDLTALSQPPVAMVGSRRPTITGSETAWRFAYELANQHVTIVSGLALGIDAQAHRGCLAANGRTIAVMGTGVDNIYPRQHLSLAEKIVENGLLLSEFPLQSLPIAGHFPRRNRIISGLSLCTLVVEAAIRSGSLITARFALEQNREVLAIPGSIYNPQTQGCHYLLQQGAKLVTLSRDVLDELRIEATAVDSPKVKLILASENKNLVKCVGFEVTTIDQIITRSGLSVEKVVCNLAELEIQGVVQAVPGGYMRCTL